MVSRSTAVTRTSSIAFSASTGLSRKRCLSPKPALLTSSSTGRPGSTSRASTSGELVALDEVGGDHLDLDAVLGAQCGRHLLEPRGVASDQHQVVTAAGELDGELVTDAGGGTGDQGGAGVGAGGRVGGHAPKSITTLGRDSRAPCPTRRGASGMMGPDDHHARDRQPEGWRRQDHQRRLHRGGARRARALRPARRPRPAGLPDLLPRHRPRGPRAVGAPRAHQGPRPERGHPRHRGRRRPDAGHDRARPRRGRPADPHRSRARHPQHGRGPRRQGHPLRLDPARLPALARGADRRRAHRRRRRPDPAAVRDALAPRRRPAARHGPRRTPLHQPRPRGLGRPADAVRRPHHPRAHRAGDDLGDLRPRGRRAADPQDDQVRRGAGRRSLDPRAPAAPARALSPTAPSPPTSSSARRAEPTVAM